VPVKKQIARATPVKPAQKLLLQKKIEKFYLFFINFVNFLSNIAESF